jgi:hypothetical protein
MIIINAIAMEYVIKGGLVDDSAYRYRGLSVSVYKMSFKNVILLYKHLFKGPMQ